MDDFSSEVAYPTIEEICEVNRRMIEEFGGLFQPSNNLHNLDTLEYILDAVALPIYGIHLYPTLKEKAAAIAFQIISRHVFNDGNKRTGAHIAWAFLRANGVSVFLDDSIVILTETIAKGEAEYEELLSWLHSHQES